MTEKGKQEELLKAVKAVLPLVSRVIESRRYSENEYWAYQRLQRILRRIGRKIIYKAGSRVKTAAG